MPQETSFIQRKIAQIRRDAEERDAKRRAEKTNAPYVDTAKTPVSMQALGLISEEEARGAWVAPIQIKNREVALAAYDASTPEVLKIVEVLKNKKYEAKLFTASKSALEAIWQSYKFIGRDEDDVTGKVEIEKGRVNELLQKLKTIEDSKKELENLDLIKTNTTSLLEIILAGALGTRSSDVHIEAEEERARLRYRMDGDLHDVFYFPNKNYQSLVARIKLLSSMKINVRGEAQDGRFTIEIGDKDIEMRVSIIPSEFGETIVMRILDPSATMVTLQELGLRPDDYSLVEEELKKPHGLILNTGPTGSGKTTTLYAFLRKMVTPEVKIITVEDPIEYHIQGIEQTQVNNEVGYTFAKGLRAIVRQDPDVILIGEIRDEETADIALQASLTGHMVFSTVHANDAIGAIPRLVDLGAKPVTIGPALNLVIAQRLVRVLCKFCKKEASLDEETKNKIENFVNNLPERVDKSTYKDFKVYEPVGCKECNNFGFKGRIAIFEFFKGGQELIDAISKEFSQSTVKALAEGQKMVTMQEDGILKALNGVTTFKEVEEVTGPISWK